MGKDKLRRFAENLTFENLVQPSFDDIFRRDHALKGRWRADFFGRSEPESAQLTNSNPAHLTNPNPTDVALPDPTTPTDLATAPLVLELGCGKGEYTVGLAASDPCRNFLGIDIKGARMWRGAKTAAEMGLANVGFLRTRIEFIGSFFGPGEVSEIWITFPDPQLKKGREKKRLTSPVFLALYARFLAPGASINLKTDSRELHDYTRRVIEANGLPCKVASADIYGEGLTAVDPALTIKTAYERRFLEEGKPITYLRFGLGDRREFEMVYDI